MLEITAQHIANLADDDLRILVGLLCEAQLRRLGLPTSAVTFGGHQDASDAGLDVRVALPPTTSVQGFVPRPATGFQVKKADMPRSKILDEMRPHGQIRPVIQELADQSGAYIIVSSAGSTSDSALRNRRNAMAQAASGVRHASSLTLEFYDRTRLATWVRDHPGLIPWVREKIGKAILGWRSYGAWAYAPEGVSGEYLIDEKARIHTGQKEDGDGLSALEGIKRIRDLLRDPGKVVRLVGLSGVGKTRLVQALFDERVEGQALDTSLALYANMADGPDPQPTGLASDLIAARTRAIVVIDNCPAELHRRLTDLCRSPESTVSVITIEYDIREDEPEGTEVLALEPSSVELVEMLIKRRFNAISAIDARTIAEFSGGNARVAIALANTIGKNDTISGLKDEELFKRLFQQRHEHDESLLIAAQACSLVYSFQGEDISSSDAELPRLAALIGKSAQDVFRGIAELRRRDLIQKRDVWRAVLPHAVANRLAAMALQDIPLAAIEAQLINGAPERLIKSFSRRLGYLHDSTEAVQIVEKWLGIGGLLGEIAALDDLGKAIFNNVAPVAPGAALAALERALNGAQSDQVISDRKNYIHLLRSLAYDPNLFDQSVALLLKLSEGEEDRDLYNDAANAFESLFYIYLSGTHAPIEQRLGVIQKLVQSDDLKHQGLGLQALSAALEAGHFSSSYSFEFGGRSRDYGYQPRTKAEITHWFLSGLTLVETLACSDLPVASQVRATLAQKFHELWTMAGMYDDLDRICQNISAKQHWRDGWIAVRETLTYDSKKLTPEANSRLTSLELLLRPTDLLQKVRYIVLSTNASRLDLSDFEYDSSSDPVLARERTEAVAQALGKEVAEDTRAFGELLPELVCGGGRLFSFGRGLATGTPNPEETWKALAVQLADTPEEKRNVQALRGFLSALREKDPRLFDTLLDDAVEGVELASCFPILQTAVPIDEAGVIRLKRSLAANKAPIEMFQHLAWGGSSDSVSGAELKELILLIAAQPNGYDAALEILGMRLYSDTQDKRGHDPEVIEAGRELMRRLAFGKRRQQDDYNLGEVVTVCLSGQDGASIAQDICRKLKYAISKHKAYAFENPDLVHSLLKVQPAPVLDALFAGNDTERHQGAQIVEEISEHHSNPLNAVREGDLFEWCEQDPVTRYPTIAAVVSIFHRTDKKAPLHWTNLALRVLDRAPDRVAVLKQFVRRFTPTSWSGSRAVIMESNAQLLRYLETYPDPLVVKFIPREEVRLRRQIEREREWETQQDKASDERFE